MYESLQYLHYIKGFPAGTSGKEPTCQGSIPGSGRSSPGGGHGNPFQYSCQENPMDRETWRGTVHRVATNWTQLKWLSMHSCTSALVPVAIPVINLCSSNLRLPVSTCLFLLSLQQDLLCVLLSLIDPRFLLFSLFSFLFVVRMEWQNLSFLYAELETRSPWSFLYRIIQKTQKSSL